MKTSKKIISLLMCMLMVLSMAPLSVFATVGPTEIDTIHVEGVLAPQYGDTVDDHFDDMIKKGDDGEFKVNGLGYYVCDLFDDMGFSLLDKDKKRLDKSEVIVEGIYYFAMDFLPSDGYVIPNDVAVTLDGALSVETEFDEDGWLTVWAKFEVKATEIDTVHIEGIPAPLYGQTVKEYNDVMRAESMNGTHTINGSARVNNGDDIFYGNIELAEWEYYNSEKSYLAPSPADALPSVYYLVHWLYPVAGYKFPDDVAVTVDGAVSVETELDEDGCLAVWAEFEIAAPTEIDTVHIEGVPAPQYGQTIKSYYEAIEAKITDGTITVNDEVYDSTAYKYGNLLDDGWNVRSESDAYLSSTSTESITEGTYYVAMWFLPDNGYVIPEDVSVLFDGAKSVKIEVESDGCLDIHAEFEVEAPAPTEITAVELTVSGYQCGGFANQITFTGSEGIYMIPSTYPVFTDINDFEGTALDKYDGFCRDTEYWVSAAFAAADGYALPELSKNDITLKGFTVLDKYVSYDATEQTIWVAFKLSAHSFDDDSDNTCNLCNKDRYTYTEADGKATITAYNGPGGAVNIPSTIGGYPVTVIGEDAFCEKYDITSVSIPDSVTTIEEDAFYDNELTSVHIGKGVTSIGEDAFAFSAELETITVDEDNDYYLSENNVLFDIDKEELIVYAVKKTDTSYTVPATVKKIHRAAFNFAENLKSITISDGVTDIGSFAFSGCENITSLIIPNSVTSIGSYAFGQMYKLKSLIISDGLTTVSSYAFQYCSKLTDVVIPASVTSIEGGAFRYCPSLSDIYYTGTQAQWENVAVNNHSGYHDKFLSANVHYNAQVVNGHVYDNACDAECNLCPETRTAPHTYIAETTKKATTSADGVITYKCSACGDVQKTEAIAKIKSVTLSKTDYIYDGKNKTPKVTVKDADGNTLVKNVDYKTSVASKRSGIGRYTVKVTFIGNYSGTKSVYFYIKTGKPATVKSASQTTSSVKLSWSAVPGASGYTVYRYSPSKKAYVKAGTTEGTSLTVKSLYAGTKYTFRVVSYGKTSGGKVYDSDSYALLKTATKTATPTLSKVTTTKGKAVLTHTNVSGETGYTVYYSTKKDSGFKKYANFKADTTTCNITGLTSGKTYYFKVRTYITTDSGYVYSAWSTVKSVKVK